jgi:hypothetical protein
MDVRSYHGSASILSGSVALWLTACSVAGVASTSKLPAWDCPPECRVSSTVLSDGFQGQVCLRQGTSIKHGAERVEDDQRRVAYLGTYRDGIANGQWVFYFSNGQISSTGHVKDAELHGVWEYWNRQGEPLGHIGYHEGRVIFCEIVAKSVVGTRQIVRHEFDPRCDEFAESVGGDYEF